MVEPKSMSWKRNENGKVTKKNSGLDRKSVSFAGNKLLIPLVINAAMSSSSATNSTLKFKDVFHRKRGYDSTPAGLNGYDSTGDEANVTTPEESSTEEEDEETSDGRNGIFIKSKIPQDQKKIQEKNRQKFPKTSSFTDSERIQVQNFIDKMIHAKDCRMPSCYDPGCKKLKLIMTHFAACPMEKKVVGCPVCKQVLLIVNKHSQMEHFETSDNEGQSFCSVPFCQSLRSKQAKI